MPRKTLRVLVLEDSAADAELIQRELLRKDSRATSEIVDTADAFERALIEFAPHVVVSDHTLAEFSSRAALHMVRTLRPAVPLIVVSGFVEAQTIVELVRAGAEDVVLKGDLTRLVPAIDAALLARQAFARLSPRQQEVLRLIAEGHTTSAIADQLVLSAKTVETHRGEVMRRLDIHDLVRLVRYAMRVGLVPLEP